MLRERAKLVAYQVWTADLALTALAFFLAWWLRSEIAPNLLPGIFPTELYPLSRYLGLLPWLLGIWTVLLLSRSSYGSRRTFGLAREVLDMTQVVVIGTLGLAAAGWMLRLEFLSRPFLLLFAGLDLLLLVGEKLLLRIMARRVRAAGFNYRTLLIVGTSDRALEMAAMIQRHRAWGIRLLGLVRTNGKEDNEDCGEIPVLGDAAQLEQILADEVVDEVMFVLKERKLEDFEDQILLCSELGIRARVAMMLPHLKTRLVMEDIEGIPLLTFQSTPGAPFQLFVKRALDLAVSSIGLVISAPLLAMIALAIRASSKGPALFRQERCGLNGRRFTLLKFRTMVLDAEARRAEVEHLNELDGPVFKASSDPRITALGRLLRRLSLDELPQLVNVFIGDMSLVGPRPPLPDEVAHYERWQRRRLSMQPGLTGLWQVSGRSELDFETWMRLDLDYIDHWSLSRDLRILLRTLPAVLSGRGAR